MQMMEEKDQWPFDPMQPGDHEPVRVPDNHPAKEQQPKKERK
jgi:hypothetical protein